MSADSEGFGDLGDEGPEPELGSGYLYTAVIGIETPEGECTTDPSTEIEALFDHDPTPDEIAAVVLNQAAPWLNYYLAFGYFADRFGANPALCIVGEAIERV